MVSRMGYLNIMDVFNSERSDLLQLVDTSVGSIQTIDLSVAMSDHTQPLNLDFGKAGFGQYPASLPKSPTGQRKRTRNSSDRSCPSASRVLKTGC